MNTRGYAYFTILQMKLFQVHQMARMVEGLLLHQQQQQQPIRQRTASIASRSVIGITNGNRPNEVKK